jgi:hypothetical protein
MQLFDFDLESLIDWMMDDWLYRVTFLVYRKTVRRVMVRYNYVNTWKDPTLKDVETILTI